MPNLKEILRKSQLKLSGLAFLLAKHQYDLILTYKMLKILYKFEFVGLEKTRLPVLEIFFK